MSSWTPSRTADALLHVLTEEYSWLGLRRVQYYRRGSEAAVYRGESHAVGAIAIKVPHSRRLSTGNERDLDTRDLLRQEWALAKYAQAFGIPTCEPHLLHLDDEGPDFLVSPFVEDDASAMDESEFGLLIGSLHAITPPVIDLVAGSPPIPLDDVLSERIERRLTILKERSGRTFTWPSIRRVLESESRAQSRDALLHMDLRRDNVLVRSGRIMAIVDWSNALVGDPGLDLARAAESGNFSPSVLASYGEDRAFAFVPRNGREVLYRLDTAVMLAHVFHGSGDAARAGHYLDRVVHLCGQIL